MKSAVGTAMLIAGLVGFSAQALAGDHWKKRDRGYHAHGRYTSEYDYAPVVDVEPIVRQVRVESPRRECWDEVRHVYPEHREHGKAAGPMILGGVIGGVIGHQFGSGRGKDAATLAGTLIGASIGHDRAAHRSYHSEPREQVVERCAVSYEHEYEERIDGYRVTYEYNGREYTTRLPYDPGKRIRVRVAVAPAE